MLKDIIMGRTIALAKSVTVSETVKVVVLVMPVVSLKEAEVSRESG